MSTNSLRFPPRPDLDGNERRERRLRTTTQRTASGASPPARAGLHEVRAAIPKRSIRDSRERVKSCGRPNIATAAEQPPSRSAERARSGRRPDGSQGRRSNAAVAMAVRPHLAHTAPPMRCTTCSRHTWRRTPQQGGLDGARHALDWCASPTYCQEPSKRANAAQNTCSALVSRKTRAKWTEDRPGRPPAKPPPQPHPAANGAIRSMPTKVKSHIHGELEEASNRRTERPTHQRSPPPLPP